eukprot:359788-Chlamydomonas_euryale.AAC.1
MGPLSRCTHSLLHMLTAAHAHRCKRSPLHTLTVAACSRMQQHPAGGAMQQPQPLCGGGLQLHPADGAMQQQQQPRGGGGLQQHPTGGAIQQQQPLGGGGLQQHPNGEVMHQQQQQPRGGGGMQQHPAGGAIDVASMPGRLQAATAPSCKQPARPAGAAILTAMGCHQALYQLANFGIGMTRHCRAWIGNGVVGLDRSGRASWGHGWVQRRTWS